MAQIICPHCGFTNFAISAYCGRCERPLPQSESDKPGPVGSTPAAIRSMPPRAKGTPPPPPPNAAPPERPAPVPLPMERTATQFDRPPSAPPTTPPIERIRRHQAPRPMVSSEPTAVDVPLAGERPGVSTDVDHSLVGPQQVHDDPTVVRSVAVPEQAKPPDRFDALYDEAVAKRQRAARAPQPEPEPLRRRPLDEGPAGFDDMVEAAPPPDTHPTVVPTGPAPYWRLICAGAMDALVVMAVPLAVMAAEMLLFEHWPAEKSSDLEAFATWLSLYPGSAVRALLVLFGVALVYTTWGGRRGATLGRQLTGLLTLQINGDALGWVRASIRAVFALVSLGLFGAGFFWALVDERHRTWHDVLSGSLVVQRR